MPRGLVRSENLRDLPNRDTALQNLQISIQDVERIQGAAFPYGVQPQNVQRIAASSGNFQQQVDTYSQALYGLNSNVGSGIYVRRSGDQITGTWTNSQGFIQASGIYVNGVAATPSTDSLFSHAADGTFEITTTVLRCASGITVERIIDHNNIVMSGTLTPNLIYPVTINGVSYNIEAARL